MHEPPELDADGNLWPGPETRAELARLSEAAEHERRENPELRERWERARESYAPIQGWMDRVLPHDRCGREDCWIESGREGDAICDECATSTAAEDTEIICAAVDEWHTNPGRAITEAELMAASRWGNGDALLLLHHEIERHQFTMAHEAGHRELGRPQKIPAPVARRTGARARSKGCAGTRTRGSRRSASRSSSRGGDSGDSDSDGPGPGSGRPHLHLVPDLPALDRARYSFGCLTAEERGADVEPVIA